MEGRYPLKSEMDWVKSGSSYALTPRGGGATVQMDSISFLVWVQCDGKTSIEEIVDVFAVGGNRDVIKAAISGVLQKLTDSGMVSWV